VAGSSGLKMNGPLVLSGSKVIVVLSLCAEPRAETPLLCRTQQALAGDGGGKPNPSVAPQQMRTLKEIDKQRRLEVGLIRILRRASEKPSFARMRFVRCSVIIALHPYLTVKCCYRVMNA
jgi:hypothetical protein